jgi:hypothetical protein
LFITVSIDKSEFRETVIAPTPLLGSEPMTTYAANVYFANVGYRRVTVEAQNAFEAKAKLEAMYGAGKVISVHTA